MARSPSNLRPGALVLAFLISVFVWAVAHGQTDVERIYDLPLELAGLGDELVVTEQSVDAVNIRIVGSRAALGNIDQTGLRFPVDLAGAQLGVTEIEVPDQPIDLPRGAAVVSRSPSRVSVRLERKGRRSVGVRADVMGEPASGFRLKEIEIEPRRVWLAGARTEVMRLAEVVTEPIDLTGLTEDVERDVRVFLGAGTVWMEEAQPVRIHVHIEPDPLAEPPLGAVEDAAPSSEPAQAPAAPAPRGS